MLSGVMPTSLTDLTKEREWRVMATLESTAETSTELFHLLLPKICTPCAPMTLKYWGDTGKSVESKAKS